jgi:phage terminase large subunit-like protein
LIAAHDTSPYAPLFPVAAASLARRSRRRADNEFVPLPHQRRPDGDWRIWIIKGGRGSGKTRCGVENVMTHLREFKSSARVGIGGRSIDDVRSVCLYGESGLFTLYSDEFTEINQTRLEARHRRGGFIKAMGAEEPARWNGPQWSLLWADELALWDEESWDMALFGLRLPPDPRCIVTTTPKARKFVRDLYAQSGTVVTHGTLHDNPHTAAVFREMIQRKYGGSRLGRQEINGEDVDDVDGALFQRPWIESHRVTVAPALSWVCVACDPAVTAGEDSDETGLAVAGVGEDGDLYLLASDGLHGSPLDWATRGVFLFDKHEANELRGESNQGGDMVRDNFRNVRPSIPYEAIHARRGKYLRAEPVATLYEQGRVHHVGVFAELEDQQCSFVPGAPTKRGEHWDRLDAAVYALLACAERESGYSGMGIDWA